MIAKSIAYSIIDITAVCPSAVRVRVTAVFLLSAAVFLLVYEWTGAGKMPPQKTAKNKWHIMLEVRNTAQEEPEKKNGK